MNMLQKFLKSRTVERLKNEQVKMWERIFAQSNYKMPRAKKEENTMEFYEIENF